MPRNVTAKKIHVITFNPDKSETITIEYMRIKKSEMTAMGIERRRYKNGPRRLYMIKAPAAVQLNLFET